MLKSLLVNRANNVGRTVIVVCVSSFKTSLISSWKGVRPGMVTTGKHWSRGLLTEKTSTEIDKFHTTKKAKMIALKEDHIVAWIWMLWFIHNQIRTEQ